MKKLISLLLVVFMVMLSAVSVFAADQTQIATECFSEDLTKPLEALPADAAVMKEGKLDISAKSSILMEVNTGEILYEDNANERLSPASITKIMSLLLIMEAIDDGRITLETAVTTSEHAASMGGSQIWLEPGETMTVHELLKATVIASANDATVALAEHLYGSEETFVAKMNEKAKQLGLENTSFVNCSGLDAEGHFTSAHDVAVVSCELLKHKLITDYSTVWMDSLRNGESELVNTNKLVKFYSGCTGLKTGTTGNAGCCLSASACRDGMELVAVVMGSSTSKDRFNGARKMLDYGFANFEFKAIAGEIGDNSAVKVKQGVQKTVTALTDGNLHLLLPKGTTQEIKQTVYFNENLTAPIYKNDEIGMISVTIDGQEVGAIKLIAATDVKKLTFGRAFLIMLDGLFCL